MSDHAGTTIQRILASAAFHKAAAVLAAEHERMVDDIIRLTETASPPFQESTRARMWFAMAERHGLSDLEIDAEGNVTGLRRGIGNGPLVCVAAHLDTVFPAGTNVTVRREGTKLFAPGIGDDTRSLSVLLAWLRALDAAGIETRADILFVADVGEEGLGDLRGMRHLFQKGPFKGQGDLSVPPKAIAQQTVTLFANGTSPRLQLAWHRGASRSPRQGVLSVGCADRSFLLDGLVSLRLILDGGKATSSQL